MNLTLVTISALFTAAESVASTSGRSLHWGKHRGGGKFMLAKLQEKIVQLQSGIMEYVLVTDACYCTANTSSSKPYHDAFHVYSTSPTYGLL